jgi:transcriptional regulator with PAS, ATPase and Fis domain
VAGLGVETLERAAALFEDADLPERARRVQSLLGSAEAAGPGFTSGARPNPLGSGAAPATRPARRSGARVPSPARRISVRGARGQRELLTHDASFGDLVDRLGSVARASGPILLLGETGTGKELLARLVHAASGRRGRFVAANAAAFPEGLVESELFGHLRGAFTGAVEDKVGLIEAADGGTFFLDEVGDLPPTVQVKLLRVLDETVIRRVGAIDGRPVDVRFVAATNQDLRALVREGTFRRDLFYRLSVHEFDIPPLRERRGDVALLSHTFLGRLSAREGAEPLAITPDALAALEAYAWPGNVRELESEMERAHARARDGREVRIGHLSPWVASRAEVVEDLRLLRGEVAAFERMRIREALSRFGGNMARAAESLGMTRQALRYKIQKYGLASERSRPAGKGRE